MKLLSYMLLSITVCCLGVNGKKTTNYPSICGKGIYTTFPTFISNKPNVFKENGTCYQVINYFHLWIRCLSGPKYICTSSQTTTNHTTLTTITALPSTTKGNTGPADACITPSTTTLSSPTTDVTTSTSTTTGSSTDTTPPMTTTTTIPTTTTPLQTTTTTITTTTPTTTTTMIPNTTATLSTTIEHTTPTTIESTTTIPTTTTPLQTTTTTITTTTPTTTTTMIPNTTATHSTTIEHTTPTIIESTTTLETTSIKPGCDYMGTYRNVGSYVFVKETFPLCSYLFCNSNSELSAAPKDQTPCGFTIYKDNCITEWEYFGYDFCRSRANCHYFGMELITSSFLNNTKSFKDFFLYIEPQYFDSWIGMYGNGTSLYWLNGSIATNTYDLLKYSNDTSPTSYDGLCVFMNGTSKNSGLKLADCNSIGSFHCVKQ